MRAAITVSDLGKTYRRYHPGRPSTLQEAVAKRAWRLRPVERTWALRDVSFNVGVGKTVGLVGSNGSGKSTLLRLIGGVGRPDMGRIEVCGRLGALLDLGAGFHPDLTGRENALLSGVLNGLTRREVLDRMDAIVAFSEIDRAIDDPVRTYSSGMQMRLAFATAVHTEPEVLLIDEVLAVGDVSFQRKCLERISLFRSAGCSILIVSHEVSVIRDLCDEAIWMDKGRLKSAGPAGDTLRDYLRHMEGAEAPTRERERQLTKAYPTAIPFVPRSGEPWHGSDRFGTRAIEIVAVRLVTVSGQATSVFAAGDAAVVELEYTAATRVPAPIFLVRISRDDGMVCYDHAVNLPDLGLGAADGRGIVRLRIDRLDLNSGSYVVDVGVFAHGWVLAYDCQLSAGAFTVHGTGVRGAVLNVPHRWEAAQGARA